jgi:hypothetical protein
MDGGSQSGKWSSRILDYTPMGDGSSSSSGSLTFSYPWGVSFSTNLGGRTVDYSTEAGGVGSGYVQVLFEPSSPIKDARASGCVTTKSYQNSTINTDPKLFKIRLIYFVNNLYYIGNPNTYYTDTASHTISGR